MFINDVVNDKKRITVLKILWSSLKDTTLYENCLSTLSLIAKITEGCSRKKVFGVEQNLKMGLPQHNFMVFCTVHMEIPGNTPTHQI